MDQAADQSRLTQTYRLLATAAHPQGHPALYAQLAEQVHGFQAWDLLPDQAEIHGVAPLLFRIRNIVGPLVLWLFKKDESKVVDREGRNSINFQTLFSLAAILVAALFGVLSQIPLLGVLFVFVGGLLLIQFRNGYVITDLFADRTDAVIAPLSHVPVAFDIGF